MLEVIIALAIFSISIIALYTIQTRTINQNSMASKITTASTWASEKVEELMTADYDDVVEDPDDKDGANGLAHKTVDTVDGSAVSPDGVYTVLWNVAETYPLPNTKTIRVFVTTQRKGAESLVELEYIKHKG